MTSLVFSSTVKSQNKWSTPTQLTNNTTIDSNPSISGDGTKIAFQSNMNGEYEIYIISLESTPSAEYSLPLEYLLPAALEVTGFVVLVLWLKRK